MKLNLRPRLAHLHYLFWSRIAGGALVALVLVALTSILASSAPGSISLADDQRALAAFTEAAATATVDTGAPRSAVFWLDNQPVQLFERATITLHGSDTLLSQRRAEVTPQAVGHLSLYPGELFTTTASPHRASLTPIDQSVPVAAQPLQPLDMLLRIPGYNGMVELRVYDAAMRLTTNQTVTLEDGRQRVQLVPRGSSGRQWVLVLVDGAIAAAYQQLLTVDPQTTVQTGNADIDRLYPTTQSFLEAVLVSYELDGTTVRGYRSPDNPLIWLRDHVSQGRGFRYFERDMTSTLDAFRAAQRPDGSFPDVLDYPARDVEAHRLDPESDVEFLFIQGVYEAWQATGDDAWLRSNMDAMRRGLVYITSDPLRWDAERGLVKRPYTIDTWDFQYGPSTTDPDTGLPSPRHWFDEQTRWGIFHGDNTGLAYAMRLLATMERYVGNEDAAATLDSERRQLMQRLMDVSWNGTFFTHFVPLEGTLDVPGVDTSQQLSLSNTYALNRELLDVYEAQPIIQSYYQRRDFDRAFAEWYSIDPPFPAGSFGMGGRPGDDPGEYVNGGIMPLVGGELARGAFRYGSPEYGFDILHRYADILRLSGTSYLWYYPTGAPGISGPDTVSTDGWGSSAMLGALMEGAAGVEDRSKLYQTIHLSPRWAADPDIEQAYVVTRYAASDAYVAYVWERGEQSLHLDVTGTWRDARVRLLLPREGVGRSSTITVLVDGETVPHTINRILGWRSVEVLAEDGDFQLDVMWE